MQNRKHAISAIFFGMLLGNAAVLYGAEEEPAATADTGEDQTAEEMLAAEAALEAQEAAAASEAGESNTADPATADADETGEPDPSIVDEDFVPTIQISEDLSVSFPVDI
jgi:hypothetical protein